MKDNTVKDNVAQDSANDEISVIKERILKDGLVPEMKYFVLNMLDNGIIFQPYKNLGVKPEIGDLVLCLGKRSQVFSSLVTHVNECSALFSNRVSPSEKVYEIKLICQPPGGLFDSKNFYRFVKKIDCKEN